MAFLRLSEFDVIFFTPSVKRKAFDSSLGEGADFSGYFIFTTE